MADLVSELKNELLRAMERQFGAVAAQRDILMGSPLGPAGGNLGHNGRTLTFMTLATGYDSGTGLTTSPFMLDFSLLDGPDLLVEET